MVTNLEGLEQIVAFTFLFTFFGMAAAALFFFVERERVAPEYRQSVVMSSLICGIAALNYLYMKDIFIDSAVAGEAAFPTEFRYIDWFLTVPVMILKFPSLLGLGERGRSVMTQLVALSVAMIACGFIGELNPDNSAIHLGFYAGGCVAGLGIIAILGPAVRNLPPHIDDVKRTTIVSMATIVIVGWLVYPIGYLQPTLGFDPAIRELIYNIADLTNKVGLGLVVYFGGRRALQGSTTTQSGDHDDLDDLDDQLDSLEPTSGGPADPMMEYV